MASRWLPVPLTFILVLAITFFLIVFFGAWAVSADAAGRSETIYSGFAGSGSGLNANTPSASQLSTLEGAGPEDGGSAGTEDRWWAKGFLKACPFH